MTPAALAIAGSANVGRHVPIRIEVDLGNFRMHVARGALRGPAFAVALGSPAHPTPAGSFHLRRVIRKPAWNPGPEARRRGGTPVPASLDGPMGIAKIPFEGSFALHAGAHPLEIGKGTTLGCVKLSDASMLELIAWLRAQGALAQSVEIAGELHHPLVTPVELRIRR